MKKSIIMNMNDRKTQLTNISEAMKILKPPTHEYDINSWVNARIQQYAEIIQQYDLKIEAVYLQVNKNNLKEAYTIKCGYPLEIETWEDVAVNTYRIEFETGNPYIDTLTGSFPGIYGDKTEAEITWALWRTDYINVNTASEMAKKLA